MSPSRISRLLALILHTKCVMVSIEQTSHLSFTIVCSLQSFYHASISIAYLEALTCSLLSSISQAPHLLCHFILRQSLHDLRFSL